MVDETHLAVLARLEGITMEPHAGMQRAFHWTHQLKTFKRRINSLSHLLNWLDRHIYARFVYARFVGLANKKFRDNI